MAEDEAAKTQPAKVESNEIALSDKDIEEFVARQETPADAKGLAYLKKHSRLLWYRVVHWYQHRGILERLVHIAVYLYLPLRAAKSLGWSWHTALGILGLIGLSIRRNVQELSPEHMQVVQHNYLDRKLRMVRLLEEMKRADTMSARDVERFREDALSLIAGYVRSYRFDLKGKKIFANLLVIDGDDVIVIARNEPHRIKGARYNRHDMLAGKVFDTGEPQVCGDVYADFPWCRGKKSYRSVLALPIWFESRLAGVLTIDSQLPHHFDGETENLFYYLGPYMAVLGWTLSNGRAIQPTVST